jgi:hypothetical protein
MKETIDRLGIMPFLLLGAGLLLLGVLAASHIVDNFWPFDVSRLDLVRATALDRVDASSILDAGNSEILLALLASVMVAATGLVMPLVYFLNRRFGAEETTASFLVVARQAMWFGLWLAFCVWLQMNRSLGVLIAGLVAVVLVMFEILLQVRGRAASLSS